jgi:heme-degrading monooxygenase HmoA
MPYLLVHHNVEDYARWRRIYDEHAATRKASGASGTAAGRVFRSAADPNELVILLEWDDLEKARQFAQSEDLRQTMQRAGVVDQPDVYFLNEA